MRPRIKLTFIALALLGLGAAAVPASADARTPRIRVTAAKATPSKFFYGGRGARRQAVFEFELRKRRRRVDVRIDAIGATSGEIARTWRLREVRTGIPQTLEWDGRTNEGTVAPEGRYAFRIRGAEFEGSDPVDSPPPPSGGSVPQDTTAGGGSAGGVTASRAVAVSGAVVGFYHHYFPVRGEHSFGEEGAKFGADRGNHTHEGHDIFSACGTPLVAARAGRVKFVDFQAGGAGNYVVIDGSATDVDYVYMHLQEEPLVEPGQLVRTGQRIGLNGDTGRAFGCHLHFELWNGAWRQGGQPFDPLPELERWDSFS